jgi:hypothetical protein
MGLCCDFFVGPLNLSTSGPSCFSVILANLHSNPDVMLL